MSRVAIKDIARVVNGSTPATSCDEYYDGDIIWFTPRDLSDQKTKYIYKGERTITQEGYDSCSTELIPAYNILMSSRAPIGLISINMVDCCTNQGFKSLLIDKQKCNVDYLYYYLIHHIKEIETLGSGTTFKEVSKASMESYEIELPTLDEQERIAKVLSFIDMRIDNNKVISSELEDILADIYDYWFLQFDFPDEKGHPYKASGGKMEWNEKLKRNIPAGWGVDKIGNYVSVKRGISYSSNEIGGDGIPMINLNSFNTDATYKVDGIKNYSGSYTEEKKVMPYDLLVCTTQQTAIDLSGKTNVIGKALLVPDIFDGAVVASTDIIKINCDKKMSKHFLRFTINYPSIHKYIVGYASGTSIMHLNINGLLDMPHELPPASILRKFDEIMDTIERKKSNVIKENQELEKLRDFLLPLLMSGQVKFNDK